MHPKQMVETKLEQIFGPSKGQNLCPSINKMYNFVTAYFHKYMTDKFNQITEQLVINGTK